MRARAAPTRDNQEVSVSTQTAVTASFRVLCILCLGSINGCGGETAGSGSTLPPDGAVIPVPAKHRASALQCSQSAPVGTCACNGTCAAATDAFQRTCSTDNDCTDAGTNGRCAQALGPATCGCTSDTCNGDDDCATGQTCACHGSPYTFGSGNTCVPGNCRVDADCGAGGYCSPTPALPCNVDGRAPFCQAVGYYCHTTRDQCVDDSDCQGVGFPGCLFDPSVGYWRCQVYAQPL
jgi:hypothetical protein